MFLENADKFVFFGDSLSDAGAIYGLTSELLLIPFPLDSAGYDGVVSNGPVYTQILPDLLGVDSETYAVASARATGERFLYEVFGFDSATPPFDPVNPIVQLLIPGADLSLLEFDVNLQAQVGRFLADFSSSPTNDITVASFLIGLNDFGRLDPNSPTVEADAAALLQDILASTLTAAQATVAFGGVDGLVFYSFPTAEFLPTAPLLSPEAISALNQLIAAHDEALHAIAEQFDGLGIPAEVVELAQITTEIDADMGTFGFFAKGPVLLGSATDPQIGPPTPPSPLPTLFFPPNPAVAGLPEDAVQFYDFMHPTTAMHGIWSVFTQASLTKQTHFLDNERNVLRADSGDDFVLAKGGNDVLFLGDGDDIAFGGLGDDRMFGGDGGDILSGGSGDEILRGGDGSDLLVGNAGDDRLYGGDGDDLLIDGSGSDIAHGGRGADVFVWREDLFGNGACQDLFFGGRGMDTLYLWLSEATATVVQAEIDARSAAGVARDMWDFASIGVSAKGIEDVFIIASSDEVDGAEPQLVVQADLWGFV